jgi:hypothetical protein
MKTRGFATTLFAAIATQKERLGEIRIDDWGRVFRYAKAGASALAAGKASICAPAVANHIKQVQTGYGAPVGSTNVTVLLGATAVTADQYKEGWLHVYDGAAGTVGTMYPILGHTTKAGAGGAVTLQLAEPLRVAIAATDTISLVPSPFNGTTESGTQASPAAGVTPIAVPAGSYYWSQTGGPTCGLATGALALGSNLCIGDTAGALKVAAGYTSPFIGWAFAYAGVDTKYSPIWLTLD